MEDGDRKNNKASLETVSDRESVADPNDEVKDHRLLLEEAREARLRALGPEEKDEEGSDVWGGSDEEPPDAVRELMTRTATHLQSANSPAQLVARILANHGGDDRFSFLRGRWHRAWATSRAKARVSTSTDPEQKDDQAKLEMNGLAGLSAYADSDDGELVEEEPNPTPGQQTSTHTVDAATIERRRQKAREWVAKRKAEQQGKDRPQGI